MESSTRANYDFSEAEQAARDLWQSKQVYERAKSGNLSGPKFYFVDGPPYTSGTRHIHLNISRAACSTEEVTVAFCWAEQVRFTWEQPGIRSLRIWYYDTSE
jgi:hypothetical protein